jgi:hypothetical protein
MKLYTEEQVKEMLNKINAVLPKRASLLVYMVENITEYVTPIEIPSDEDMANASNHCKDGQVKVGFLRGVLWMKEQILNQNK